MRKKRKIQKGAIYHVTARTNRKELILLKKEEKSYMISIIKRAKKKYEFSIESFNIMNNHIHLIIKPGNEENLSRIMQWILSVYAMSWNRRHKQTGHVWGQRFFSRILENYKDVLESIRYVDSNPLKAGLIDDLSQWEFGSPYLRNKNNNGILGPPPLWLILQLPYYRQLLITNY